MAVVQVVLAIVLIPAESSVSMLEGDYSSIDCSDDQQPTGYEEVVSMLDRLKSPTETIVRRLCAIVSDAAIRNNCGE